MSLYREVGRRNRAVVAAAVLGLAIGLIGGVFVGRATTSSPSLASQAADLREELREATDALELVVIEYGQAVENGRVVAQTELAAAQADLERAQEVLEQATPDIEAISPGAGATAIGELVRLAALIERRAPTAAVEEQARAAEEAVRSAAD
jgi:hypothetical protein